MAISSDLERLLARWLPRQRWMPALGGRVGEEPDITPLSVARIADVTADAAGTVQCLLVVLTVRGPRRSTRLCVPLSVRTVEDYALRSHLVGVVDDLLLGRTFVYDGAADPVFVLALADAIRHAGPTTDPQVQTFLAGDELPDVGHPDRPEPVAAPDTEPDDGDTLLERAAVHRFRRTDGLGSESRIEIDGPTGTFALTILREIGAENPPAVRYPLALTAAESASVHPAVGWSQTRWFDDTDLTTIAAPFALLSHALPASRRAWREAVETVMRVDSGSVGSFNREASALGTAVGRLHMDLGAEFGLVRSEGDPTRRLIRKWRERVDWALSRAPGALGSLERALREHADSLDGIDGIGPLQRIHGELTLDHITVGTAEGPRVISFAVTPDDPRPVEIDLVAMLRSIDYAAGYAWLQRTGALGEGEPRIRALATQGLEDTELRDDYLAAPEHLWYRQTVNSLLSGYSHAGRETKSVTDPVLHAALIDRLLVEVVSEMRSRPAWLIVPLAALAAALGDAAVRPGPEAEDADHSADAHVADEDVFVTAARAASGAAPDRPGTAGQGSDREDPDDGIAEGADILPDRSGVEDDRPVLPRRRPVDESGSEDEPHDAQADAEVAPDDAVADAEVEPTDDAADTGEAVEDAAADEEAGATDAEAESDDAEPADDAADADEFAVPAKPDRPPPGAIVPPAAAPVGTPGESADEPSDDPELDEDGAGEDEPDAAAPPRSARDSRGATSG
ncbi:MAG TPA: hypothetical protein VK065_05195 [Brevibacterium sp.]|nr:hypothetical protein [Brevibacterium sp.]HLS33731.1 hypothetical protein [Brevibacterium sp.]